MEEIDAEIRAWLLENKDTAQVTVWALSTGLFRAKLWQERQEPTTADDSRCPLEAVRAAFRKMKRAQAPKIPPIPEQYTVDTSRRLFCHGRPALRIYETDRGRAYVFKVTHSARKGWFIAADIQPSLPGVLGLSGKNFNIRYRGSHGLFAETLEHAWQRHWELRLKKA